MGVGNLGKQLSYKGEELATYLSRDGGMTWFEVKKGPYHVAFGDHGSVIVMAPLYKSTRQILYSMNEGLTWNSTVFSDAMVDVDNILIEPKSVSTRFVIHGHYANTQSRKGVIISLDFSQLNIRTCEGAATPEDAKSDYELWTPYDGRQSTQKCFLGKTVQYVRRKREAECLNGENHEQLFYRNDCECTEMDFECDIGYKRSNSGLCEKIKGADKGPIEVPENCEDYYEVSQGYRKVPGNTCFGGDLYEPLRISCPSSWSFFSFKTFFILLVMGGIAFFAVPKLKETDFLTSILQPSKGAPQKKDYQKDFSSGGKLQLDDDDDEDGIIKLAEPRQTFRTTSLNSEETNLMNFDNETELSDIGNSEQRR
jgi:hypothetical protein